MVTVLTKHTVTSLATGDQALLQTDLVDMQVRIRHIAADGISHPYNRANLAAFPEYQGVRIPYVAAKNNVKISLDKALLQVQT
jgi:hypothetical protein